MLTPTKSLFGLPNPCACCFNQHNFAGETGDELLSQWLKQNEEGTSEAGDRSDLRNPQLSVAVKSLAFPSFGVWWMDWSEKNNLVLGGS